MRSIEEGIVCNLCGAQWSTHGTACKPKTVVAGPVVALVSVTSSEWVADCKRRTAEAEKALWTAQGRRMAAELEESEAEAELEAAKRQYETAKSATGADELQTPAK